MNLHVVAIQTWEEFRVDFAEYWYIYLSMPFIAAFIGYITKILALDMLYRPLEFKGIGPFGWQGIVPRRAGKVAAVTIELLTENLLKPEEIIDRIDAQEAMDELREPLTRTIDEVARELAEQVRPGLWDSLPEAARRTILTRIHEQAPRIVDNLLTEMKSDLSQYIDLQFITVQTLVRNKAQLNNLMKNTAGSAMSFVRRSGIYFGFLIGIVQMFAWAIFHQLWLMPAFGFFTGFVSDWVALNMLFRPQYPKKYFGITFHGVLHADREEITKSYAKIMATDLFAPEVLFEAILHGPSSDRLFAAISREVSKAIDDQSGVAQPLVQLAVGSQRYREMKTAISTAVIERMPDTIAQAHEYTARAIDVENIIADKMSQLSNEQFEAIMRPIFKDDEWLMITVGAVLGGIVGELQVQALIVPFGGGH